MAHHNKTRVSICLVLVSLISLFIRISSAEKELVLTLDHSNFFDTLTKHNSLVVQFYDPWCDQCMQLAPEYEKAASILSSIDPPVILAKVDVNEEKNSEIRSYFRIMRLPTIKILRHGGKLVQDYKGPHEADSIVEYLKKQSGPATSEIKSADDASALIGENKVVIVGVFPKFYGEEFENFNALADKLRFEYDFGHTLDAKHLPSGESSVTGPLVRLFKPFDELFVDFHDFHVEALEKFVEESSLPIVTVLNNDPSNHPFVQKFFDNPNVNIVKAMMFLNFTSDNADSLKLKFRESAEQYRQQGIRFLLADLEASEVASKYYGFKENQAPVIVIQQTDGNFFLKTNLEPDHISTWLKAYKDGSVEPVHVVNDEPAKVVGADNLEVMVFDSKKNVLVELNAPCCGDCQNLVDVSVILEEVAASYQSDPDVIIVQQDFTANDIPSETSDVKRCSTMYFKSARGKISVYDGNMTKEDIIDFISRNRDKADQQEPVKADL